MTAKRILLVLGAAAVVAIVVLSPARQWAFELVTWIRDQGPGAAAATALGMLPGTIMYVYLGSLVTTAGDLGEQQAGSWFYWVGGAVAVVGGIAVTLIARRALQRELAKDRA